MRESKEPLKHNFESSPASHKKRKSRIKNGARISPVRDTYRHHLCVTFCYTNQYFVLGINHIPITTAFRLGSPRPKHARPTTSSPGRFSCLSFCSVFCSSSCRCYFSSSLSSCSFFWLVSGFHPLNHLICAGQHPPATGCCLAPATLHLIAVPPTSPTASSI